MHERNSSSPTCGLYVHVPFCETKCGYCDFYSVPLRGRNTVPLVTALCKELDRRVPESGFRVRTVFCGGGTPTLLPIDGLERLLVTIGRVCDVAGLAEFTVEANPATVDDDKAALLKQHGVSRVSMGAQTFIPAELAALERLHKPEDIAPSVATLRRHGIGQINLDLIFGIPGQTRATWAESLDRTIQLGVDHIACYGLTYEPGTTLTARRNDGLVVPCDEHIEADMYGAAIETLRSAGYRQYEISNFAKPGRESKHNLIYWHNEPFIGVGPSAAGYYQSAAVMALSKEADSQSLCTPNTLAQAANFSSRGLSLPSAPSDCAESVPLRRYKNVADVSRYVRWIDEKGHAEAESEMLDAEKIILEMLLMQLRLNEGLSIDRFQRRSGFDPRTLFEPSLSALVERGLVTISNRFIALTAEGRMICNQVISDLAAELPGAISNGRPFLTARP